MVVTTPVVAMRHAPARQARWIGPSRFSAFASTVVNQCATAVARFVKPADPGAFAADARPLSHERGDSG
jgi:hypothetical protein